MTSAQLDAMIEQAARGRPFVCGTPLGKKPSYFIYGDVCTERDLVVGKPFSGPLADLLASVFMTIKAQPEECYVTYLVKAHYPQGTLTEKEIEDSWLPIVRHEYVLSGCKNVVAVGKIARLYAGHVQVRPAELPTPYRPGILSRVVSAWRNLTA